MQIQSSKCNSKVLPADPNSRHTSQMSPTDEKAMEAMTVIPYREAVGCLMYIMLLFWPDIAFAVSQVAQHCQNQGTAHWKGVQRIFSYLHGTSDYGLCTRRVVFVLLWKYTDLLNCE
jgi:hypothetical protein